MSSENNPDLILVDANDREIGALGKIEAHKEGLLHRAFSVFLYHEDKLLLQKRASHKYHSGDLWSNTCCSHPTPHESLAEAVVRRLEEELGIDPTCLSDLREVGMFHYACDFADGFHENENDHVFVGEYQGPLSPNPDEIAEIMWVSIPHVEKQLKLYPKRYSYWFSEALFVALRGIKASLPS